MTRAIRAEFRKFFTTRLWWGLLIPSVVAGALFAWLAATLFAGAEIEPGVRAPGLDDPQMVSSVYAAGLGLAQTMLLAIGILTVGAEYRHKTITGTFLATPHRATAMAAKAVALLVIGAFYGLVCIGASFAVGASIIRSKGFDILPEGALRTLALCLLVLGLWGLIGLGIGILIPNQVVALFVGIAFTWVIEPLLTQLLRNQDFMKTIGPYLPGKATEAVVSGFPQPGAIPALVWWAGALVLVGYAVVLAGLGTLRTVRADIS